MMRSLLLHSVVLILLLLDQVQSPAQHDPVPDGVDPSECKACHSCKTPTQENPCLIPCKRPPETAEVPVPATSIPEVVILGHLSQLYVPVVFPHALHVEMESMADGCNVCHHHNPPGKILACRDCHSGPSNQQNLKEPSLKGAYHRQCLSCHREWSHETDCNVCHVRRTAGNPADPTPLPDASDIMGRLHPNISTPDKWIYSSTEMADGPVVTFHHQDHVKIFGLKCVDCHRKENCSRCHDEAQSRQTHRDREDPHQDCAKCHDTSDNCAVCHTQQEAPRFNHEIRTGFPLKPYHANLECVNCHLAPKQFAGLSGDCASCHAEGWFPASFDHALAGLVLDVTHTDASCTDCHESGLGKPATCQGCHDDGRNSTEKPPGQKR